MSAEVVDCIAVRNIGFFRASEQEEPGRGCLSDETRRCPEVQIQQDQRQLITQRVDPRLIMANSILQLTTVELVQSIENELLENPALATMEETPCAGDCIDPANCPYCSARKLREKEAEQQAEAMDFGDNEADYDSLPGTLHVETDEDYDPVGNLEAEMTLQEHLRELLRAAVPTADFRIGEYIINSLNDKGYLTESLDNIALELDEDVETIQRILEVIQGFDPPGVGARNLQECLLLQLRYLREEDSAPDKIRWNTIAENIVRDHFDHLHARRYAKLARTNGITIEEARQISEYIAARLNPYPASQFRPPWAYRPTNNKAAIRPDVVIRRTELGYEVDVFGAEPFSLGLNPVYRDLYNQIKKGSGHHSDDDKKHITEQVERAELFIRHINQRRKTLRMITKCIIECQQGFLETGNRQFLRPLTRTRVAKMLSIHESTVSRATANKYVQLPNQEVVKFDVFFNSSLSIKDAIEEIIQSEDPSSPLSDQQITDMLVDRGIHVARRTIVKYREDRKILSSARRRR